MLREIFGLLQTVPVTALGLTTVLSGVRGSMRLGTNAGKAEAVKLVTERRRIVNVRCILRAVEESGNSLDNQEDVGKLCNKK